MALIKDLIKLYDLIQDECLRNRTMKALIEINRYDFTNNILLDDVIGRRNNFIYIYKKQGKERLLEERNLFEDGEDLEYQVQMMDKFVNDLYH